MSIEMAPKHFPAPNNNEHSWCQTLVSNISVHQKLPSLGREMNKMSLRFLIVPESKTTFQSHDKDHRSYAERAPTGQSHDNWSMK